MNTSNTLSVHLSRREIIAGWIFFPIYLIFLSTVIVLILTTAGVDLRTPEAQANANLLYGVVSFVAVCIIFHRFLIRNLGNLARRFWGYIQAVILSFVIYWAGTTLVGMVVSLLQPELTNINNDVIVHMAQSNYRAMLLYTVALAPVIEETLFRGLIFSCLHRRHRILAYAVSAVAFSALHIVGYIGLDSLWNLALCFLEYLPAGIALGWAYERADSIWAPITLHIIINAISMLTLQVL